jgi:hypothetical protein
MKQSGSVVSDLDRVRWTAYARLGIHAGGLTPEPPGSDHGVFREEDDMQDDASHAVQGPKGDDREMHEISVEEAEAVSGGVAPLLLLGVAAVLLLASCSAE